MYFDKKTSKPSKHSFSMNPGKAIDILGDEVKKGANAVGKIAKPIINDAENAIKNAWTDVFGDK